MKKIFFVLPTIGFGGAEKVFIELASYIASKKEHDVTLVYLSNSNRQREIPSNLNRLFLDVPNVRSSFIKLNKMLLKEKPDVVFSTIEHLNIFLAAIKKIFRHNFKLYIRHTSILSTQKKTFLKTRFKLKILKYFYNSTDCVIFQSEFMRKDFESNVEIYKSVVINNPVQVDVIQKLALEDIADIHINKDEFNIIFIGRLTEVKNVSYILKKVSMLKLQIPFHLYIIGEGDEREKLLRLCEKLDMLNNVTFLGHKSNPYKYLKEMDLLVNTSKSEGFPNVLLEALALNIPVVVKEHPGGTKELMESVKVDMYVFKEIDFVKIFNNLEMYPPNISSNIDKVYGIERIYKLYSQLINEK